MISVVLATMTAAAVALWRKGGAALALGGVSSGCTEDALRARVVEIARAEVGQRRLDVYFADAAPQYVGQHPEWCGIFALWCLHQAGLLREKTWKTGLGFLETSPRLPRTSDPRPGDICYFEKYQHQSVVLANNGDGTVSVANGNGAGGVVSLSRPSIDEAAGIYSISNAIAVAVAAGCK